MTHLLRVHQVPDSLNFWSSVKSRGTHLVDTLWNYGSFQIISHCNFASRDTPLLLNRVLNRSTVFACDAVRGQLSHIRVSTGVVSLYQATPQVLNNVWSLNYPVSLRKIFTSNKLCMCTCQFDIVSILDELGESMKRPTFSTPIGPIQTTRRLTRYCLLEGSAHVVTCGSGELSPLFITFLLLHRLCEVRTKKCFAKLSYRGHSVTLQTKYM